MPPTPEPFDLDAVTAESSEDRPGPFPFTFGGETFHLPGADEVDVVLIERLNKAGEAEAARILLDNQWDDVVRLRGEGHHLTADRLAALLDAWKSHIGGDPGESQASGGS